MRWGHRLTILGAILYLLNVVICFVFNFYGGWPTVTVWNTGYASIWMYYPMVVWMLFIAFGLTLILVTEK